MPFARYWSRFSRACSHLSTAVAFSSSKTLPRFWANCKYWLAFCSFSFAAAMRRVASCSVLTAMRCWLSESTSACACGFSSASSASVSCSCATSPSCEDSEAVALICKKAASSWSLASSSGSSSLAASAGSSSVCSTASLPSSAASAASSVASNSTVSASSASSSASAAASARAAALAARRWLRGNLSAFSMAICFLTARCLAFCSALRSDMSAIS
mmetsp:Transcript_60005/g.160796  ORF Transcript_60005/g.160796 Transcript_60005/m.160796 type:complete len:216 (+) Transcript_60005:771-1418(+)